ncbi:MAG: hypothetical protein WEC12_07420 [Balneolaceae bacterium]
MSDKFSHSQNVLDSGFATVTSGGHWFHATRDVVEKSVPGLLERRDYEKLVMNAVTWIESTDSLSLVLYYILVFVLPAWIAAVITVSFYFWWYYYKSSLVNIRLTPVLKVLNHDAFQLGAAAVILSILGISGNYAGVLYGLIFFFLFKVGLLRLLLNRIEIKRSAEGLTLNDRVLKMVLVRSALYEEVVSAGISRLDDHLGEALLAFKQESKASNFKSTG